MVVMAAEEVDTEAVEVPHKRLVITEEAEDTVGAVETAMVKVKNTAVVEVGAVEKARKIVIRREGRVGPVGNSTVNPAVGMVNLAVGTANRVAVSMGLEQCTEEAIRPAEASQAEASTGLAIRAAQAAAVDTASETSSAASKRCSPGPTLTSCTVRETFMPCESCQNQTSV